MPSDEGGRRRRRTFAVRIRAFSDLADRAPCACCCCCCLVLFASSRTYTLPLLFTRLARPLSARTELHAAASPGWFRRARLNYNAASVRVRGSQPGRCHRSPMDRASMGRHFRYAVDSLNARARTHAHTTHTSRRQRLDSSILGALPSRKTGSQLRITQSLEVVQEEGGL